MPHLYDVTIIITTVIVVTIIIIIVIIIISTNQIKFSYCTFYLHDSTITLIIS